MGTDDLIDFIKGQIYKIVAKPDEFTIFFKDALQMDPERAGMLTLRYLGTCQAYRISPGFGGKTDVSMVAGQELQNEMMKLGVGTFSVGSTRTELKLRIADYLSAYPTAAAARKALTPAKRDALRAEANKILQVPDRAWKFVSKYATFGVRG
ncbi:hypothetical protein [Tsuneonella sp. SYSU-LHT278]|uniref:hypothetical protein n=1 Tax=Tsuneonella sediminis TaxID=3416089 RepID=UPI003F799C0B